MLLSGCLEVPPQLFGDEWRKWMQHAQTGIQNPYEGLGGVESPIATFGQLQLGYFDVPIGKFTPEELINLPSGFAVLICGK